MTQDFDIIVVGAGPVGAVTAGLLAARKIAPAARIALLANEWPEAQAPSEDIDLRVFALSRAAERILELCGAWQTLLPARVSVYERMCVWDGSGTAGKSASIEFDCAEIGEPNLGSIVDGRALAFATFDAARRAGVAILRGEVAALESVGRGNRLRLADGRHLAAKLLLGADGAQSTIRQLAGIETAGHSYAQSALVAHIRTRLPHRRTAWQRFLPTGPLAFLPLADGRSSIVWSLAQAEADRLKALDATAFAHELTRASDGVLGECALVTGIKCFPLQLRYALHYVRRGLALLGDAAHAVHPLAGQGLNLGLMDAAVLADVLESAGDAAGDLRVLRRYERWRKSENMLSATLFDGFDRLFSNAHPALTALRSFGLSSVERAPLAKREFARRALGLGGDVPAFLRGARPS
jgi:2-polyprenylphenol 6-hydroxylase